MSKSQNLNLCPHKHLSPEDPWDQVYCHDCRQKLYDWQTGRSFLWLLRYRWTWFYFQFCIQRLDNLCIWLENLSNEIRQRQWKNEDYLSTMVDRWNIY